MAFVVPIATAVGGGSAAAGATLLATAAVAGASAVESARMQRRAGAISEAQSEIDAKAEGDAARQREIQRKRGLLRAISSQVARAGATGVAFEGSPRNIAQLDIDEANDDLLVDRANTRARQRGLRGQGRAARIIGRTNARNTLTQATVDIGRSLVSGL